MGPLRMVGLLIGGRRRRHLGGNRLLLTGRGMMIRVLVANHHGGGVVACVLVVRCSSLGASKSLRGREQRPDGRKRMRTARQTGTGEASSIDARAHDVGRKKFAGREAASSVMSESGPECDWWWRRQQPMYVIRCLPTHNTYTHPHSARGHSPLNTQTHQTYTYRRRAFARLALATNRTIPAGPELNLGTKPQTTGTR